MRAGGYEGGGEASLVGGGVSEAVPSEDVMDTVRLGTLPMGQTAGVRQLPSGHVG